MKKKMAGLIALIAMLASAGVLAAHHSLSQFETTTAVWAKGPESLNSRGWASARKP